MEGKTIKVSGLTYKVLRQIKDKTGIPIRWVVDQAVEMWMKAKKAGKK